MDDASAQRLAAGDLTAEFLPARGMLGASLRHRGVELLRRVDDLGSAAAKGSTAGIPFLHPWANRLAALRLRVAGRDMALDASSSLLHFDAHGQAIHGVPWSRLAWDVVDASASRLVAQLAWSQPELLAIFPFPHAITMTATLDPGGLTIATALRADRAGPVPVSFGFHPYFGLSNQKREQWRLRLPAMRKLMLDARGIPTGKEQEFAGFDEPLGESDFDDGFALGAARSFALTGGGTTLRLELLAGYDYAQVYAPRGESFVALEPMTAPTNALASGRGLQLVPAGGSFDAVFRIGVAT